MDLDVLDELLEQPLEDTSVDMGVHSIKHPSTPTKARFSNKTSIVQPQTKGSTGTRTKPGHRLEVKHTKEQRVVKRVHSSRHKHRPKGAHIRPHTNYTEKQESNPTYKEYTTNTTTIPPPTHTSTTSHVSTIPPKLPLPVVPPTTTTTHTTTTTTHTPWRTLSTIPTPG